MDSNNSFASLSRLLLKPAPHSKEQGLFSRHVPELNAFVTFRSLDLSLDLDLIYQWVTKAYTQKFWQLNRSKDVIEKIYRDVLDNPQAHSFIGMIDGKPICQIDVYMVMADELAAHVESGPTDAGMHLLMCPPREMRKGWSWYAIKLFQQYYFSVDQSGTLYAEPDQANHPANQLAINTGFRFLKTIELSYKTANLYCMHREDFRPV